MQEQYYCTMDVLPPPTMEVEEEEEEKEMLVRWPTMEEDESKVRQGYEKVMMERQKHHKKKIKELRSKIAFLRLCSPLDDFSGPDILLCSSPDCHSSSIEVSNPVVPAHHTVLDFLATQLPLCLLHLCSPLDSQSSSLGNVLDNITEGSNPGVPAHSAVLKCRSPIFREMLENDTEESRSGIIKIPNVSNDILHYFVHYLYTAELLNLLDEQKARQLLILGEHYRVKHLKDLCEKFLVSKVNLNNVILNCSFAHQYNAKHLYEATFSLILDNMRTLVHGQELAELAKKGPELLTKICMEHFTRRYNTGADLSTLQP